jgi:hypothetical protein
MDQAGELPGRRSGGNRMHGMARNIQSERSDRAARRLERGLARSRAVVAAYRARLLLLREAFQGRPSPALRAVPGPNRGD